MHSGPRHNRHSRQATRSCRRESWTWTRRGALLCEPGIWHEARLQHLWSLQPPAPGGASAAAALKSRPSPLHHFLFFFLFLPIYISTTIADIDNHPIHITAGSFCHYQWRSCFRVARRTTLPMAGHLALKGRSDSS